MPAPPPPPSHSRQHVSAMCPLSGPLTVPFACCRLFIDAHALAPLCADENGPILSYTAIASPGGRTAVGQSSPLVVSGLVPGQNYTFRVFATNADGPGTPSLASATIQPTATLLGESSPLIVLIHALTLVLSFVVVLSSVPFRRFARRRHRSHQRTATVSAPRSFRSRCCCHAESWLDWFFCPCCLLPPAAVCPRAARCTGRRQRASSTERALSG